MLNFDNLIRAELVWDGGDEVRVPSGFEAPAPDQMTGTPHEKLSEVACRTCYDSCGIDPRTKKRKGRSSEQLHAHILEVKNHNVYEHADFTVRIEKIPHDILTSCFINRPGVWCELTPEGFEVTMNHRCVLEWDRWETSFGKTYHSFLKNLGCHLWEHARTLAPQIYPESKCLNHNECRLVSKNEHFLPTQASVSLYLSFSRGASQEQCRHRFRISQRSTRFVDENESKYIRHPLITQFLLDDTVKSYLKQEMLTSMKNSEEHDKSTYRFLVTCLQEYLKERGVDGTQARKQARGAARGFLGLALHTEMIFTAPVSAWQWMLSQRATRLADAEIRVLYATGANSVLSCLKASRYGHFFKDVQVEDCPDGIGESLLE
jgi:thymidylate synthase ThyX